jgi:hypothetical protein
MNANPLVEIPGMILNVQFQMSEGAAFGGLLAVALIVVGVILKELIRRAG